MLQKIAHYNDFPDTLKSTLEERLNSLGSRVRFKFDIAKDNPDPEKYNGAILYPFKWTLDPVTFRITYAEGEGAKKKSVSILVALPEPDKRDEKGLPTHFKRVRVHLSDRGVIPFDMTNQEDREMVCYLLLHPKLKGGLFADKNRQQIFSLIDENAEASNNRKERSAKAKALNVATDMTDKQVKEFASAMMWDDTEDIPILRDQLEALAEESPEFFGELVAGKNIEYQATIRKAMDNKIIGFDSSEFRFFWHSNKQTIALVSPVGDKNEVQKMAEWCLNGGEKAVEMYNKIKSLNVKEKV